MNPRKTQAKSVKSRQKQEPNAWGIQDPFQSVSNVSECIDGLWQEFRSLYPISGSWLIQKDEHDLVQNCALASLLLIRGLPGSGKSTFAKKLEQMGRAHFETDQFFYKRGKYVFDAKRLAEAHAWCLDLATRAMTAGQPVVISNTFVHKSTMRQYLQLNATALILEMGGTWQNAHGVTDEAIAKMRAEWESIGS